MPPLSKLTAALGLTATTIAAGMATIAGPADAATIATYDAAVAADKPRGYWPLDETSGPVGDLTGTAAKSAVNTAQLGVAGAVGRAASFDGAGQQIRVPYTSAMRVATSFSAEVWAKLPAAPQQDGWPTIFSRGDVTKGHFGTAMWVSSDSAHTVHFKRNGIDVGTSKGLNSSTYRHLVFTWSGSAKKWSFYVDGTLDTSGVLAGLSGNDTESAPLEIGAMLASASGSPVNHGKLLVDALAFYPTALSATRVKAHYTAANPGTTNPPTNPTTAPTTTPTTTPTTAPANGRYVGGVALGALQAWNPRRAADFKAMATANATWVRSDLGWQYLEPVKGDWRWAAFDGVVNDAKANGMKFLAILHTVPGWANGNAGDYGMPADTSLMTNYCYQTAKHYIPMGVTAYEIGNEINLPHPSWTPDGAGYARKYLVPCVAGVRKAATELSTQVNVMFGALAPTEWTGGQDPETFLNLAYANGAKGLFDSLGWHPYTGSYTPATSSHMNADAANLNKIMAANGDGAKKIWATEYGMPTGGPNSFSEQTQASDITAAFNVWYAKPFAGPMFYYQGRDTGTASTDREQHFGVLRYDGSAKPSYAVLKTTLTR